MDLKLEELENNGVKSATLLLGFRSEAVITALATYAGPLKISYVCDGPRLLGTGGAILQALDRLPEAFLVTYGDSLLEWPFGRLLDAARSASTNNALAVTARIGPADTPNCQVVGNLVIRHSRTTGGQMNAVDYGVMLLRRSEVLGASQCLSSPFGLDLILAQLARERRLAASVSTKPYWEIGTPETLKIVQERFARRPQSRSYSR